MLYTSNRQVNIMNSRKKFNDRPGKFWLYGIHAVVSALKNPNRKCHNLFTTSNVFEEVSHLCDSIANLNIHITDVKTIAAKLPPQSIHQNIALEVSPLAEHTPEDLVVLANQAEHQCIVILDQVTDPHNIGAILRTCAAFSILGVIIPKDNSPSENATIAKSSCGALELVPLVKVTNIVRTMNYLKTQGYWCIGLDGQARSLIADTLSHQKLVLVLGSEDTGLRRLTRENCDLSVKIPISSAMESLNVSNAAAIALYEISRLAKK